MEEKKNVKKKIYIFMFPVHDIRNYGTVTWNNRE